MECQIVNRASSPEGNPGYYHWVVWFGEIIMGVVGSCERYLVRTYFGVIIGEKSSNLVLSERSFKRKISESSGVRLGSSLNLCIALFYSVTHKI